MRLSVLLVALIICCSSLYGQNIDGTVANNKKEVLAGAHVSLMNTKKVEAHSSITDSNGRFQFKSVQAGKYQLVVTYLGYTPNQQFINVEGKNLQIGKVTLQATALDLKEVEIKQKVLTATQQGDTTTFNANAFKTLPDADAQDLIEKMPTVVVENGRVQAQGEEVKQVLVDGKPFFGDDPTAALKNLPAEVIDKVQIYDQQSDQAEFTGFEDGNLSKTMNIVTKKEMRNGKFGKVYAGYGYEDRYNAGGNVSLFNGDQRISIIGLSNNINIQNFATEDLLGVVGNSNKRRGNRRGGMGGGRGGGRGGSTGSSASDFLVDQQNGIATTNALGVNYTDKWGSKLDVSGSYFFNHSNNDAAETLNRAFINAETVNENYFEQSESASKNGNHRLNMVLEYKLDRQNSIIMRPKLSWQNNEGLDNTFGATSLGNELLNQTENEYQTQLNGANFSNNLLFRHRFDKPRRTISLNVGAGYNNRMGDNSLASFNEFTTTNDVEILDQISTLDNLGWNASTNLTYTEPIGKKAMLMTNYRFSTNRQDSDQETFDFSEATNEYDALNPALSNVFESIYNTHRVGTGINFRKDKMVFMVRASAQWAALDSEQQFPTEFPVQRNFFNVLPMAMFRYNEGKTQNLYVLYRTNTSSPSLTQLQNVLDNSNPVQLSIGNPELDQSYQHTLMTKYSRTNADKSSVFFAFLSASLTNDYIGNSTYLEATDNPIFDDFTLNNGVQLSRPVNLDGNWNIRSYITYGFPISKIKSNLNINFFGSYVVAPGLINDQENLSNTLTSGLGFVLSSNISDKIDFTISSKSSLNNVTNSLQANTNTRYYNQNTNLRFNWIIAEEFVFRTGLNHQWFDGLSEDFNQNFLLWNLSIGKQLFTNKRGELSLSVFDVLRQNNSIARTVTETFIEDIQTQVLQRYVMLNFTYNIRHFYRVKDADGLW